MNKIVKGYAWKPPGSYDVNFETFAYNKDFCKQLVKQLYELEIPDSDIKELIVTIVNG